MKKALLKLSAISLLLAFTPGNGTVIHHPRSLLVFGGLYCVEGEMLGSALAFEGLEGAKLPRTSRSARGILDANGRLRMRIKGLVHSHDNLVPAELQGLNDETEFRAVVSCYPKDGAGGLKHELLSTDAFAATQDGNCAIDDTVALPDPCLMPSVIVTAGDGHVWLACNSLVKQGQ